MKAAPFDYHSPTSLDEAVRLLAELPDAKVIAGGQSIVPLLALRLSTFDHLVDVGRIEELRGIEHSEDSLWLGAATTQTAVQRSTEATAAIPLLARALPLIGHFQIRNRGTIGGSLAHADPAAEIPAVALTLDATIEAVSPRGRRDIAASEFFRGLWTTALDDDEVLRGVTFPTWAGACGFAIEEVARRHGDFAIAGACVAVELTGDDTVARCAIGLLGLASTAVRASAAEQSAAGAAADDIDAAELGRSAVADLTSISSDLNGSAEYRRRIGATVVARAWDRAVQEACHG